MELWCIMTAACGNACLPMCVDARRHVGAAARMRARTRKCTNIHAYTYTCTLIRTQVAACSIHHTWMYAFARGGGGRGVVHALGRQVVNRTKYQF